MKKQRRATKARPLKRKKDADATIASAKAIARLVLDADALTLRHKRKLLDFAVWAMTEAEYPKHKLPLRTRNAHSEIKAGGRAVQHEHVFQRKWLVDKLLEPGANVARILDQHAIACVVTVAEAAELTKLDKTGRFKGWARYRKLGLLPPFRAQPDGSWRPHIPR